MFGLNAYVLLDIRITVYYVFFSIYFYNVVYAGLKKKRNFFNLIKLGLLLITIVRNFP